MQEEPKIYLIGGAPRVGKSILAKRILAKKPMFALPADAVRDMLRKVVKPEVAPALFAIQNLAKDEAGMADYLRQNHDEAIKMQNEESAIIWQSVVEIIKSCIDDGQDILVEGVEILPLFVSRLPYNFRAVFLGNTTPGHANTIAHEAHIRTHDWMHAYGDDAMGAWADFSRTFSEYVKSGCASYGFPYIETSDVNFDQSLDDAANMLLGS